VRQRLGQGGGGAFVSTFLLASNQKAAKAVEPKLRVAKHSWALSHSSVFGRRASNVVA
jgi:hypothetical protein